MSIKDQISRNWIWMHKCLRQFSPFN